MGGVDVSLVTVRTGDMFAEPFDALVDPVNCIGVHGKGLAKEFKKRFPGEVASFNRACESEEFEPGMVWTVETFKTYPNTIAFVTTKAHWRQPSRLEWIESALKKLENFVSQTHFYRPRAPLDSMAIPALGCGFGGLAWDDVRPLIVASAERMKIRVDIFEPRPT